MKSSKPKKFLKNNSIKKINGLIIPPFLTSQTTASTTHKNTLNINSLDEINKNHNNLKKQYSSRNYNYETDRINPYMKENNDKEKQMLLKKLGNSKANSSYRDRKKSEQSKKSNKNNKTYNNLNKNNSIEKNLRNKSKDIISFDKLKLKNYKNAKNIKLSSSRNDSKIKTNKNISKGKKYKKELNITNNKNKINNLSSVHSIKLKKKNLIRKEDKKIAYNNSKIKIFPIFYKKDSTKTNKITLRNNSINNLCNHTSIMPNSNSVDKKKINKTIYFKKKMEDCFKIINNKSTKANCYNKKKSGNIMSNHNHLVNLILKGNKKNKIFEITDNKSKKKLEKKNSVYKLIYKRNIENNNTFIVESPIKNLTEINRNKKINTKKIVIKQRNNDKNINNRLLKQIKSVENMKLNNINKGQNKNIFNINMNKKKNSMNNIKRIDKSKIQKTNFDIRDSFQDIAEAYSKQNNLQEKNDKDNIINDIKINNFNVKKPKDSNLKFKIFKNRYEDEDNEEEMNKSKIVIGTIDSYKDIKEIDNVNNNFEQNEGSINVLESNTLDNNTLSKKRNKKILLNFKLIDENEYKEKNRKNNDIEGLEIYNSTIDNGFILNDSEIESILNCVEDENDINDLSTTILKKNKRYKNKNLFPYHVNIISFVQKYNKQNKKFLINENINNDNTLLIDNNKYEIINRKDKYKKNNINKMKSDREIKKQEIIKYMTKFKINLQNQNNNIIQKSCNLFIEKSNKNCVIF